MPVGFKCEVCNYTRELPDTYAGKKIHCPQCAAAIQLPDPAPAGAGPPTLSAAAPPPDTRPCPFCAEPIKTEARKCRWCGEIVDRQLAIAKQQEKVREVERKREILLKEAPGAKGSLILGIVGLLLGPYALIGFLLGPIAIVMAVSARRAIRKEPRLEGQAMATAGLVLGIITIAATILMLITNVHLFSRKSRTDGMQPESILDTGYPMSVIRSESRWIRGEAGGSVTMPPRACGRSMSRTSGNGPQLPDPTSDIRHPTSPP